MIKEKQSTYGGSPLWASGFAWSLAFVLMALLSIWEILAPLRTYTWTVGDARIIRTWVRRGTKNGYHVHVRYGYAVNGARFESETISPGLLGSSRSFSLSSSAEAWRQKYPVGRSVPIWYDPNHPERVTLLRGFEGWDLLWLFFLWAMTFTFFDTARKRLRGARTMLRRLWRKPRLAPLPKKGARPEPVISAGKVIDVKSDRKVRPHLTMDLDSPLERFVRLGFIFMLCAWVIALLFLTVEGFPRNLWPVAAVPSLFLAMFAFLYARLSCAWQIDPKLERIFFCRSIGDWEKRWPRHAFEDVAAVAVDARFWELKHGTRWEYVVILVLKDGTVLPVSDFEEDALQTQNERARRYAEAMGVPLLVGRQGSSVHVYFDAFGERLHVEPIPLG